MAASTKTSAHSETAPRGTHQNRRREISGILLLAGGLFSAMSLVSMQVGGDPLMGPGGGAVATGLYSLFGLCAYLVLAAASVAAVRCFRARPLVDGLREGAGSLLLLCAIAVLLHLPFTGSDVTLHGPGGLFGQWLGEVGASFIGAVGAALAATTMLVVGVLLVTEISLQEAMVVIAWAARHAQRGLVAGALATWRTARAAFPEKDDAGERHRGVEPRGESDHEEIAIVEPVRAGGFESELEPEREIDSAPARIESQESEAIRVGAPRTVATTSPMSAPRWRPSSPRSRRSSVSLPMKPKWRMNRKRRRLRRPSSPPMRRSSSSRRHSPGCARARPTPRPPPPRRRPKRRPKKRWASSGSPPARSSCRPSTCWSTFRRRRTTSTSSSSMKWPSDSSRQCRTTAYAARSKRSTWDRWSPCTSSRRLLGRAPARSPTWRRIWRWRWRPRRFASWRRSPARRSSASRCRT